MITLKILLTLLLGGIVFSLIGAATDFDGFVIIGLACALAACAILVGATLVAIWTA